METLTDSEPVWARNQQITDGFPPQKTSNPEIDKNILLPLNLTSDK